MDHLWLDADSGGVSIEDSDFEDKLIDVIGLHMNPPDGAIVLSFDEESQIQALDRTQQSCP
jgi:hypothetical protein